MIQKLTLISVLAMLSLLPYKECAQEIEIMPFQIGDRVPNLPLKNIINYKDSTATLSSFGNKLIILDFWNVHCTTCIRMFPLEDSLQHVLGDKIQFLLVTQDASRKVGDFIKKWNISRERILSIPIVAQDLVLTRLFRYRFIPHYVWIAPTGEILGQTSEAYISFENILQVWKAIIEKKEILMDNNYPQAAFTYPELSQEMKAIIIQLLNQN